MDTPAGWFEVSWGADEIADDDGWEFSINVDVVGGGSLSVTKARVLAVHLERMADEMEAAQRSV